MIKSSFKTLELIRTRFLESDYDTVRRVYENLTEIKNVNDLLKAGGGESLITDVENHVSNVSNPHQVDKGDVDLANVDNTSDATKTTANNLLYEPINANIQTHIGRTDDPHNVTATQVGLGNVDNISDATQQATIIGATDFLYEPIDAGIQAHIASTANPHSVTYAQLPDKPTIPTIPIDTLLQDGTRASTGEQDFTAGIKAEDINIYDAGKIGWTDDANVYSTSEFSATGYLNLYKKNYTYFVTSVYPSLSTLPARVVDNKTYFQGHDFNNRNTIGNAYETYVTSPTDLGWLKNFSCRFFLNNGTYPLIIGMDVELETANYQSPNITEYVGFQVSKLAGSTTFPSITDFTGLKIEDLDENSITNGMAIWIEGEGIKNKIAFGATKQVEIYYDGTDLIFDSTTGDLKVLGSVKADAFVTDYIELGTPTSQDLNAGNTGSGEVHDIVWDTVALNIDTDTFTHDAVGANPERITVDVAGRYEVIATIMYDQNTGATRTNHHMFIRKNDTTDDLRFVGSSYHRGSSYATVGASTQLRTEITLAVADFITIRSKLDYAENASSNVPTISASTSVIIRRIG